MESSEDEVTPPLEPVGVLRVAARTLLEANGVRFEEETRYGCPGPTQWAVVELDDGAQFLVEHHYAHKDRYVAISGQVGRAAPVELCRQFVSALSLGESDVSWIAEGWGQPDS